MPWYLFAIATPLLYSISNYVDKFLLEKRIRDPLAITALAAVFAGMLGIVLGTLTGWQGLGVNVWIALLAGLLLVFYLIPYYAALKTDDASRVAPLYGFIPVFHLIISSIFLHETLAAKQITGMGLVVAGGLILSVRRLEGRMFSLRPALWLMLLSSLLYGVVAILFRYVSFNAGYWTILSWEYVGKGVAGLVLLAVPSVRRSLARQVTALKQSIGIIAVNDGIAIAAQMSEAYAVTLAIVPLVSVLGGTQPFFTLTEGLLLTLWFPHIIREDIRKNVLFHKFISVCLMFAGLYLVYT